MNAPRTYRLGIVGETNYQPAIRRCSVGQSVHIVHEPDNPYDNLALAVLIEGGDTVGCVPRDCWLQEAVHDEGKGCDATIKSIRSGEGSKLGVVLDVCLNRKGLGEREFRRVPTPRANAAVNTASQGFWARLFGP